MSEYPRRQSRLLIAVVCLLMVLTACNLGVQQSQEQQITSEPTNTSAAAATRTLLPGNIGQLTVVPSLTPIPFNTRAPSGQQQVFPTSVAAVPPPIPTNTPLPLSIVIVSPQPGNVVSGNVQVVGSAIHPNFLQYRLEFGPDPNPNNLWFPVTGIVQTPVLAGNLGIWSTTSGSTPDGTYQLRLRVFLRDGAQLTTRVGNIRVRNQQPTPVPTNTPNIPRPIASFTQDVVAGEVPLVVRFTNRSQGQVNSYSWDFGDGGTSGQQNPTYTFDTPGIYTVRLRVQGPGGSANVSREITVRSPSAPTAAFTPSTTSGEAPLSVQFDNQSTGQITNFEWDFGDGEVSIEENPTHIFEVADTYNVILQVTGPGGSDRQVQQITVEDPQVPPPVASFEPDPGSGQIPLSVTFNNTSTGEVEQYLWDFNGDGVTDNTDTSPTHTYDQPGTFPVRLTAIGAGGQSTAVVDVQVEAPPDAPVASFSVSPESGTAPLTVTMNNSTTGNFTDFIWDFESDDQPDGTETNPQHTYQEPGTYTIQLIANGPGGSTTATQTISVQQPLQPPTAGFIADPDVGQAPLTVTFINQSEGTQLTFAWDFDGDGVVDSTDTNPIFEYVDPGNYEASLTVTDPTEQTDTATVTINVSETVVQVPPTAAFSATPLSGQAPLTVTFTDQSLGDITNHAWDFNNDGQIDSTDPNPTFEFVEPAVYPVMLTVTGSGGSNSITSEIVVEPALAPPVAAFTAEPSSGQPPLQVTFTSTSQGEVSSYQWDFDGDGQVDSDQPSATFAYNQAGEFTATLTVSNAAGADSSSTTVIVEDQAEPPLPAPPTGSIAFVTDRDGNDEIYVMNVDGTGAVNVTSNSASETQPAWSPDGSQLAFVSDRNGNTDIFVLTLSDMSVAQLTNDTNADFNPMWSPDGSQIAFTSDRFGDNDIFVMNADGSEQIQRTTDVTNDRQPTWSPDGTQIAFVSDAAGNNDIFVMNSTDGSNITTLTTDPASDVQPTWSSDNRIAFTSNRAGNNDIHILNLADLTVSQVTTVASNDRLAVWSPDNTQLLFTSNQGAGDLNLYTINIDGSGRNQVTNETSNESDAVWK